MKAAGSMEKQAMAPGFLTVTQRVNRRAAARLAQRGVPTPSPYIGLVPPEEKLRKSR